MSRKPFKVELSNGTKIKIDSDELNAILAGVQKGSPIKLRQAIINPSFIVAVTKDMDRWRESFNMYDEENRSLPRKVVNEYRKKHGVDALPDHISEFIKQEDIKRLSGG